MTFGIRGPNRPSISANPALLLPTTMANPIWKLGARIGQPDGNRMSSRSSRRPHLREPFPLQGVGLEPR